MARKRTTMNKARKILQLKEAELSQRQIAEALKISRPVISEILTKCSSHGIDHKDALTLSDRDLEELIKGKKKTTDKATTLIQSFPEMSRKLSKKGITKQYLWNEYINKHPKGVNYSQFCNLFRSWKKTTELSMHIEYKAGDKMLVDFAGHKLKIADNKLGKLKEVETYLAILGYSGLLYVEFTESQKTKDFISATENALLYFGGVPRAVVTDNLKAAVIKASKYEPELNKQTEDFTNYYRTALLPTRGYSPKDKALVENAVTLVYQRIYASLYEKTFSTIEQLNEAARTLLEIHNNRKLSRMSVSRKELFDDTERNELRSLPTERYPLKTIITAKAAFNYHVYLPEDKHYYSIPYLYRGQEITIIYDQKNVAFYHGNSRIFVHERIRTESKYTTIADHMPPNHRFYHDWSPERFKKWAARIGKDTELLINYILQSRPHPEQAFKVCLGILNMEKKYGAAALNLTCRHAWNKDRYSFKYIKSNIETVKIQMEKENEEQELWPIPQSHQNIRGNSYQ